MCEPGGLFIIDITFDPPLSLSLSRQGSDDEDVPVTPREESGVYAKCMFAFQSTCDVELNLKV